MKKPLTARLDRTSHIYYLDGKPATATQWYKAVKNWMYQADQSGQSILKRDDEKCLLYEIDPQLLTKPKTLQNEQAT